MSKFKQRKGWKNHLYIFSVLFFLGVWVIGELGGEYSWHDYGQTNLLMDESGLMGPFEVVKVVDGDTVHVQVGDNIEKLRFLGVDTPESVKPNSPVECFGKEASEFTKNSLLGEMVRLEFDSTQAERDKYGRLLVYIYLADGRMFNEILLTEGYANRYYSRVPILMADEFDNILDKARESERGLWGDKECEAFTVSG